MKSATTLTLALAAALSAGASPLAAQQAFPAQHATHGEVPGSAADRLHDRAVAAGERGTIDGWRDAARLHLESAAMRGASDPLGARCMHDAGSLYFALDDLAAAQKALAASAEHAAVRGDVVASANSYLDAALVAQQQRQNAIARTYVDKAMLLASSPLLSEKQRTSLLARVERQPTTSTAAR